MLCTSLYNIIISGRLWRIHRQEAVGQPVLILLLDDVIVVRRPTHTLNVILIIAILIALHSLPGQDRGYGGQINIESAPARH